LSDTGSDDLSRVKRREILHELLTRDVPTIVVREAYSPSA
jgi:hypothetical protein